MSEVKHLLESLLCDIYGKLQQGKRRLRRKRRQMGADILELISDPDILKKQSISNLIDISAMLKVEIHLMGYILERFLIVRDRNRRHQEILCEFVNSILHVLCDESNQEMRFSLSSPPLAASAAASPSSSVETVTEQLPKTFTAGDNPPDVSSDFDQWLHAMKMVARLPGGMPPEFRRKLWLALAEKYLKSKDVDWAKEEEKCFCEKWREDDEELGIQIVKDLHRTGSSLCTGPTGTINQAKLKRILLGYARYNPEVGYCQGFNMLGALILQVMDKEETESIKVMIYLVEGILPAGYFSGSLCGLQADMGVFRELMTTKRPRLAKHLQKLQGPLENAFEPPLTNVFTMQWFLTMFCTCLPMTCVLRVWDLVLIEGSDVLLRTALVLWGLLEERILSAKTADDFYCKMGSFSSELLNGHLTDSNGLIEKVVKLGPIEDIQKMRDRHLYNVSPLRDKKGLQLIYSDEEVDSDDDSKLAVATAFGLRIGRRSSVPPGKATDNKDRLALDISLLKKQYDRLRERQRQAHIILTTAVARQSAGQNLNSSLPVNQLLMGRNAIVTNKGKRVGPPQGAIPPARKPSLPTIIQQKETRNAPMRKSISGASSVSSLPLERQNKSGETLHWKDMEVSKGRRDSLRWRDIRAESIQTLGDIKSLKEGNESADSSRSNSPEPKSTKIRTKHRSESSSYSEESNDNLSSTDTSLCDDENNMGNTNASSLENSPAKKSKHSRKQVENNNSDSEKPEMSSSKRRTKNSTSSPQIPFVQLITKSSTAHNGDEHIDDGKKISLPSKILDLDEGKEEEDSATECDRLVRDWSESDTHKTNAKSTPPGALDPLQVQTENLALLDENIAANVAITSTSQLSPIPDITTFLSTSKKSSLPEAISSFDYTNLMSSGEGGESEESADEAKKFDVIENGVINEYFERVNIVERPKKLDLLYSLSDEDNIRNAYEDESDETSFQKQSRGSFSDDFRAQKRAEKTISKLERENSKKTEHVLTCFEKLENVECQKKITPEGENEIPEKELSTLVSESALQHEISTSEFKGAKAKTFKEVPYKSLEAEETADDQVDTSSTIKQQEDVETSFKLLSNRKRQSESNIVRYPKKTETLRNRPSSIASTEDLERRFHALERQSSFSTTKTFPRQYSDVIGKEDNKQNILRNESNYRSEKTLFISETVHDSNQVKKSETAEESDFEETVKVVRKSSEAEAQEPFEKKTQKSMVAMKASLAQRPRSYSTINVELPSDVLANYRKFSYPTELPANDKGPRNSSFKIPSTKDLEERYAALERRLSLDPKTKSLKSIAKNLEQDDKNSTEVTKNLTDTTVEEITSPSETTPPVRTSRIPSTAELEDRFEVLERQFSSTIVKERESNGGDSKQNIKNESIQLENNNQNEEDGEKKESENMNTESSESPVRNIHDDTKEQDISVNESSVNAIHEPEPEKQRDESINEGNDRKTSITQTNTRSFEQISRQSTSKESEIDENISNEGEKSNKDTQKHISERRDSKIAAHLESSNVKSKTAAKEQEQTLIEGRVESSQQIVRKVELENQINKDSGTSTRSDDEKNNMLPSEKNNEAITEGIEKTEHSKEEAVEVENKECEIVQTKTTKVEDSSNLVKERKISVSRNLPEQDGSKLRKEISECETTVSEVKNQTKSPAENQELKEKTNLRESERVEEDKEPSKADECHYNETQAKNTSSEEDAKKPLSNNVEETASFDKISNLERESLKLDAIQDDSEEILISKNEQSQKIEAKNDKNHRKRKSGEIQPKPYQKQEESIDREETGIPLEITDYEKSEERGDEKSTSQELQTKKESKATEEAPVSTNEKACQTESYNMENTDHSREEIELSKSEIPEQEKVEKPDMKMEPISEQMSSKKISFENENEQQNIEKQQKISPEDASSKKDSTKENISEETRNEKEEMDTSTEKTFCDKATEANNESSEEEENNKVRKSENMTEKVEKSEKDEIIEMRKLFEGKNIIEEKEKCRADELNEKQDSTKEEAEKERPLETATRQNIGSEKPKKHISTIDDIIAKLQEKYEPNPVVIKKEDDIIAKLKEKYEISKYFDGAEDGYKCTRSGDGRSMELSSTETMSNRLDSLERLLDLIDAQEEMRRSIETRAKYGSDNIVGVNKRPLTNPNLPSTKELEDRFNEIEKQLDYIFKQPGTKKEITTDPKKSPRKSPSRKIPTTEDLETRFSALEKQQSSKGLKENICRTKSPIRTKEPKTMSCDYLTSPEKETISTNPVLITSSTQETNIGRTLPATSPSKRYIPSTKALELRFEALEKSKFLQSPQPGSKSLTERSILDPVDSQLSDREERWLSVPSMENLEGSCSPLFEQKNVRHIKEDCEYNTSCRNFDEEESNYRSSMAKEISSPLGIRKSASPTPIHPLETLILSPPQKLVPSTEDLENRFSVLEKNQKSKNLQKKKSVALNLSKKREPKYNQDSERPAEPKTIKKPIHPLEALLDTSPQKEIPSLDELEDRMRALDILNEDEEHSTFAEHEHDVYENRSRYSTSPHRSLSPYASHSKYGDKSKTSKESVQVYPSLIRKKSISMDDCKPTTIKQPTIYESNANRPTSCPEVRDSQLQQAATSSTMEQHSDRVLRVIEENSKILHRILKKTLADSTSSKGETTGATLLANVIDESDTRSPLKVNKYDKLQSNNVVTTDYSKRKDEDVYRGRTPPLTRKGTHTGLPLRTDDNISERLTSIKNTIKSIDSLCEEKGYRKDKCQRYIDSLFAAASRSIPATISDTNVDSNTDAETQPPSINITDLSSSSNILTSKCSGSGSDSIIRHTSDISMTRSLDSSTAVFRESMTMASPTYRSSNRDLRRDLSPRRKQREEEREEYESRVRRDKMMPNIRVDKPSDFSYSLTDICNRVDRELGGDRSKSRSSGSRSGSSDSRSPYRRAIFDLDRPVSPYRQPGVYNSPAPYVPAKLEIRHTTVTSTFYDRYLTQKQIERDFPRSVGKSPVISPSSLTTRSYLDITTTSSAISKSAENSPSRSRFGEPGTALTPTGDINHRPLGRLQAENDLQIRSCDNILMQLRSTSGRGPTANSICETRPTRDITLPTNSPTTLKPLEVNVPLGLYKDETSSGDRKS